MKTELHILANREGYGTDQVGKTMSVGELIEYLSYFDSEVPVYINNDNGYTYGAIRENRIIEKDVENNED